LPKQPGTSLSSIFGDHQTSDKTGEKMPPWKEMFEEWLACWIRNYSPLVHSRCRFLTENAQYHEFLLRADHLYRELILFCIVTNAASVVVFASKFNLLQVVAPGGRRLPTALIFFIMIVTVACAFVYVVLSAYYRPALYPMISCLVTTLIFSIFAERRIGVIARE
jgi:hypothetical protein